jgi:acetolactate synthase-1/3 small subunit
MNHKHLLSVLVNDRPGVLARVSGLFNRRSFNIASLAVGPSETAGISRMTIVLQGDDKQLDQISKQLRKLIDVLKIENFSRQNRKYVDRELVLIKIKSTSETRSEIIEVAEIFRSKIVDVGPKSLTVEVTGDEGKIDAILNLLARFGILEVVRTGKVALGRGVMD